MAAKAAVIGIDLGSDTSLVAYVGKGVVDVVQNEVSKRNSASLVGFTQRERLLGDAALAQIKSNAKNSCRNFKHLLGQQENAPMVEKEKFWSTCPLATAADGNCGYDISYKGEQRVFSAPQVTAMFLTKLKEITEKWVQAKLADVVIGVPSYFSDVHRQALLDAAKIANISVLRLMNEHTATALAYGIYRSNDFDAEKPCNVAFCSMGHSMFSVSIVEFCKGRLRTLCEESDKVGGRDMNECLIREFSAQFEKKFGCNPLSNKKAIIKLEDSVEKCKKILSANAEAGLNCECLMEDNDFSSAMTRDLFEKMCEPMMDKVKGVLDRAIARCGLAVNQIEFVEVVGGASRVPWVKRMCSAAFGGKELSTTMNADESVARGCALQAAMLSPLYKVREFKVEDSTPLGISIGWMGSAADSEAAPAEDGDINMAGGEGEFKTAVVYPAGSAMNTLKMLTFYRKGPFDLKADYVDPALLVPGANPSLGSYKIDLPNSADVKKIKVKAKLTIHGTFCVEGAQMIEDEEYEETVKEKRELPPDPAADAAPAAEGDAAPPPPEGTDAPMAEGGEEKPPESASPKKEAKPPEKKYEWVEVKKLKKRTKKTDIPIATTGYPGLSSRDAQARMDEESAMQAEMKDIIETDEKRNDLEAYIFETRDKIREGGTWGAFTNNADRDKFNDVLMKAEDWLYDTYEGTKTMYVEKLAELKTLGDPVQWRFNEDGMRDEWVKAVAGTIQNYKQAVSNPGEKYGHIAQDKLQKITQSCSELQKWLDEMIAKQAQCSKCDKPVLLCADMEKKNQELAKCADEILKEPKPAPPKPEKTEEPPKDEKKEPTSPKKEGEPAADMDVD